MTTSNSNSPIEIDDEAALRQLSESLAQIREELQRIIVGQEDVVEQLLIALLAGGHCLLVGVPGLAKTLMISSLATSIDLVFNRIQFTPDLMPADITGTEVIQEDRATGSRDFRFIPGPIFANVILADEVNRTPPKTQAALLEAMQEHQVTVGGRRHALPNPFFVLATQNPIEQEGTYPLPEAQLDRFMLNILVDYPSEEDELEIVLRTTSDEQRTPATTISGEELLALTGVIRRIAIPPSLALLATRIARCTRPEKPGDRTAGGSTGGSGLSGVKPDSALPAADLVNRCVRWGAGPRASQYIVLGAKARAAMHGSPVVRREDIERVAPPVLRHRMKLNFQAEAEGVTVEHIIDEIIAGVEKNSDNSLSRDHIQQVLRS